MWTAVTKLHAASTAGYSLLM